MRFPTHIGARRPNFPTMGIQNSACNLRISRIPSIPNAHQHLCRIGKIDGPGECVVRKLIEYFVRIRRHFGSRWSKFPRLEFTSGDGNARVANASNGRIPGSLWRSWVKNASLCEYLPAPNFSGGEFAANGNSRHLRGLASFRISSVSEPLSTLRTITQTDGLTQMETTTTNWIFGHQLHADGNTKQRWGGANFATSHHFESESTFINKKPNWWTSRIS